MSNSRKNYLIDILQHSCESFPLMGSVSGKRLPDLAGLYLGKYWQGLNALIIVSNPIHYGASMLAKLLRRHVVAFF